MRPGNVALLALCLVYAGLVALAIAPGSALVPATSAGSPPWLLGPLRAFGVGRAIGPLSGALFYAGLWLALVGYALVFWRARELRGRLVVGVIAALHLLFLLAPPLLSQDVFSYIAYARLGALRGLDPYSIAPLSLAGDPVLAFAGSKDASSVYGPVFTLATYPLAELSVPAAVWTLKGLAAACSLAAVGLVWRAAERRHGDGRRAAVLVGLNPALLVHVVGGAHNEALVVVALAAALLLYVGGRTAGGTVLAGLAAALKASAAVVTPFLVAGARRSGRLLAAAAGALGVALLALGVGLVGFGAEALAWVGAVGENQARTSSFSLPYKTAELLGAVLPGARLDYRAEARLAYAIAFAPVCAWLLVRTWRGADPMAMAGWATLALLLCSAWLVPWYVAWLLPLAAVAGSRRLALATLALTAWTLAIAIPF